MLENYRFLAHPKRLSLPPERVGGLWRVGLRGLCDRLLMAAEAQGIATIAQASIAEMSDIVRETLGIPEDRDVLRDFIWLCRRRASRQSIQNRTRTTG